MQYIGKSIFQEVIVMTVKFKKVIAALIAATTCAICSTGIIANAYSNTATMILRNVSGAPGNVLNGTLSINSNSSNSYYTSYGFIYNNSFTLTVRSTNALNNNNAKKVLTKSNPSDDISVVAKYNYITFTGSLSSTNSQSGNWYIS